MNKEKHIVLLGAGAVGVLPAVKLLAREDLRLTAAADSQRVERYRRDGIFFNGKKIPLDFASPEEMSGLPPAELVIIATKTPSLEEALVNIMPLVNEMTILLPLLNGITASDIIQKHFPRNIVLKGYFLGHASVRENNHISHDGVGTFFIGGDSGAAAATFKLFTSSGINTELPEDIISAMWKKFVLNVGVNQTQAVFKADYGTMQKSQELLAYARSLMQEAVHVANAEHVSGTDSMVEDAMKVILDMPGNVKTSMLQDVLAGRITEVDAFAGTICQKAALHKIPVPFNQDVLDKLK